VNHGGHANTAGKEGLNRFSHAHPFEWVGTKKKRLECIGGAEY